MKILLAHDGSIQANKAMDRAIDLAKKFDAGLTVVAVSPDPCLPSVELSRDECENVIKAFAVETENILSKVAESIVSKGLKAETVIQKGDIVDKVLETAESTGADLIVLGSHGRHGVKRMFLGSVSSKVAERAKCDVLIVK